ncbi:hypothetical protein HRbin25_00736 [bacterium HR25]|nr:hypothetical protein HRbin25_00736 [bacterium HR25]
MVERGSPLLVLTALHLSGMWLLPLYFWRTRRLERRARGRPGCLKAFRWISRRSVLLMTWWADLPSAQGWLQDEGHRAYLRHAGAGRHVKGWVELYQPLPVSLHLGARGAPALEEAAP